MNADSSDTAIDPADNRPTIWHRQGERPADHAIGTGMAPATRQAPSHDERVLSSLSAAPQATIGFNALKRTLDIHPESLRRALRRLTENGLVDHVHEQGYRIAAGGHTVISGGDELAMPDGRFLGYLAYPAHVRSGDIEDALRSRWFRDLTWYGQLERPHERILVWQSGSSGDLVRLHVREHGVGIEAHADAEQAATMARAALVLKAVADALHDAPRDRPARVESRPPHAADGCCPGPGAMDRASRFIGSPT